MKDGFDVLQFARYIHARWHIVPISCAIAAVLAVAAGLITARKYTSTASILIGPPAGLDPRAATNVSPVYLESLRTYEHLASSDSLFLRALDHLGIRRQYSGRTVEALKRSVLRVSKPLNTRVIEISATLEDAGKAQALAQYIAEQTVALSRSLDSQLSEDVAKESKAIFESAAARLKKAEAAGEESAKTPGTDALTADLDGSRDLRFRVQRDIGAARAELADLTSQPSGSSGSDRPEWTSRQIAATQARIASLEGQGQTLDRDISVKGVLLERLSQQHEAVDAELVAARKDFESAKAKMADISASAAFRGERLDVFDPGIVPQRPSSPNIPLNVLVAVLLSAVASVGYLAFRYGYERASES
jgi:uncharacterized protein involved in exopolysaccharide biosynthesis